MDVLPAAGRAQGPEDPAAGDLLVGADGHGDARAADRLGRRPLCLLLLLVSIPFVVGGVRLLAAGPYSTFGDRAFIDGAVHRSLELLQRTGAYSRHGWDHPGPLPFYVLAPGKLLGPGALGLSLGALLSNGAFLVAGVLLVARAARARTGVVLTAALLLGALVVGPVLLRDPWGPVMVVVPLLVALVAVALRPSLSSACVAAVACSLALQAHVGAASLVAAVVAVALGLHVAGALGAPWLGSGRLLSPARPTAVVAAVVLVCWALPLLDLLRDGSEANLARVAAFGADTSGQHVGLPTSVRAVVGSSWLPGGLPLDAPPAADDAGAWLTAWVVLAGAGAVLAWRRRLREALALLALSVVGLGTVALAISRVVGPLEVYLLWIAPLPAVALVAGWAVLVLGDGGLLRQRAAAARWAGAALVLVLSAGAGLAAALAPGEESHVGVGRASRLVLDAVPAGGPVLLDVPDLGAIGVAGGVAATLLDEGRAVVLPAAPGRFETRASDRPPAAVVRLAPAGSAADTGGVLLGVVPDDDDPPVAVRRLR